MENSFYIKRCFELARLGASTVSPNPMVGCVIVNNFDEIIGEGFHANYGGPHAEVNAIASVKNREQLKTATLYVNLEPCSHFGKTPPCADLIISNKIPKVVISNPDPFEKVAGKGINKLRAAGVEVISGVLKKEGKELNKRFFTYQINKRPYIILKWAQTLDGFIDKQWDEGTRPNKPTWITGQHLKTLVHKWRAEEDAIIVGTTTARNDNPQLNVREVVGKNPLRIVLDRNLTLPENLNLFDLSVKTIVFTEKNNAVSKPFLEYINVDFNNNLIKQILDVLYLKGILSIIVEGGSILINSFINNGLWDEARIMTGNKIFGKGVKAPQISGIIMENIKIDDDSLVILKNNSF